MRRTAFIRVVETRPRPGAMLLRACAAFGLGVRRVAEPAPRASDALGRQAGSLDAALGPGEIALLTGPSGSGKSTLLSALRRRLEHEGRAVVVAGSPGGRGRRMRERTVLSLLRGRLEGRLSALASAGLGEAMLLARTFGELSEGQRFRLLLAVAMQRGASPGATLLCDEFASALDRRTARTLAVAVRRWASRHGVRVVVATAHDDLLDFLDPELLVSLDLDGPARGPARDGACRAPPALGGTHGADGLHTERRERARGGRRAG